MSDEASTRVATTVLLLDVDGVLQFPRAEFVAAIERDYRWSRGYLAFQSDLFADREYLQTLVGEADFFAVVGRILSLHVEGLTPSTFVDRWLSENIEPNQVLVDLMPRVNVQQVYLASNQEPIRGAYVERLYARCVWLSGAFLSYRVGRRKPNPDYFEHLLQTIGRSADECLFVDDAEPCVTAAADIGIPSIRFLDNNQLRSELAARGLIAAAASG